MKTRKYKRRRVNENVIWSLSNILLFAGLLLIYLFTGTKDNVPLTRTAWMLVVGAICLAGGVLLKFYNDKNTY